MQRSSLSLNGNEDVKQDTLQVSFDFKEQLQVLMQNGDKVDPSGVQQFKILYDECNKNFKEARSKIVKELRGRAGHQDCSLLKEQYKLWRDQAEIMRKFLETPLAEKLDKTFNHKCDKSDVEEDLKDSVNDLVLLDQIEKLIKNNDNFSQQWQQLPSISRVNIFKSIIFLYSSREEKINPHCSTEVVFFNCLELIIKWLPLIIKYDANDSIKDIVERYLDSFTTNKHQTVEAIIADVFYIAGHEYINQPALAINHLLSRFTWINLKFEEEKLEQTASHFQCIKEILAHPSENNADELVKSYSLVEFSEAMRILNKDLALFWRIFKYGIHPLRIRYENYEHIVALLNLIEVISSEDVKDLLLPILRGWIPMNAERCNKLITFLQWSRDSINYDSSEKNKSNMNEFTHRIVAMLWDNTALADQVLTLPKDKYIELWDMLNKKVSFEKTDINEFRKLFVTNEVKQESNTERLCQRLEEVIKKDSDLERQFHRWLNNVLELHAENDNKDEVTTLKIKLDCLPLSFLYIIQKMLDVTKDDAECVKLFLWLAFVLPYSDTLELYLNQLSKVPADELKNYLKVFNELVSDNHQLWLKLIENIPLVPQLKKLKDQHSQLYLAMLTKYSEILTNDNLEGILSNPELINNLQIMLQAEERYQLALVPIFLENKWSLLELKNPLVKTIVDYPQFAEVLSNAMNKNSLPRLLVINRLLENLNFLLEWNLPETLALVEMLKNAPQTLCHIIDHVNSHKSDYPFEEYQKDIFEEDGRYFIYDLLLPFCREYKHTQPSSIMHALWLLENQQKTGLNLLRLYRSDSNVRPHIGKLLELAYAQYLPETEELIKRLQSKPEDAFLQKILSVASIKYATLVSVCLSLDPVSDRALFEYVLNHSSTEITSPEFAKYFERRSQGKIITAIKKMDYVSEVKSIEPGVISQETLLKFFDQADRDSFGQEELTLKQRFLFALGLGSLLIDDSGNLRNDLVNQLRATAAYQKLTISPIFKNYLDAVLKTIQSYPECNQRLQLLTDPQPFSIAEQLVEKMLRLPTDQPITSRHAKIALIASLLCPVRQIDIGNCFVVSSLIHAASTPEGILQIFEDYLSLLSRNCLQRTLKRPKEQTVQIPMSFNVEEFAARFPGDNLLGRAYEFTVAGLTAVNNDHSLQEITSEVWRSLFKNKFQNTHAKILKQLPAAQAKKIVTAISQAIDAHCQSSCLVTYNGCKNNSHLDKNGAWILSDADTLSPLTKESQHKFYNKLFNKMKTTFQVEHKELFSDFFNNTLPHYVHSYEFAKDFYGHSTRGYGLGRLNPAKYQFLQTITPFMAYLGGASIKTIVNYHQHDVVEEKFPSHSKAFKVLEQLAKADIRDNLMICSTEDHAFTLDMSKIRLLCYSNVDGLEQKLKQSAEGVLRLEIKKDISQQIIEKYLTLQDFPNDGTRKLCKKLLVQKVDTYKCMNDLCQEIVRVDREIMGTDRITVGRCIDWTLRSLSPFKEKMPPVYVFADTNWESSPCMGLSCYVHDRSIQYVFTNSQGDMRKVPWTPPSLSNWSLFRFANGTNALSRTYFTSPISPR